MKKIFLVLFSCLLLLSGVLAGCSSNEGEAGGKDGEAVKLTWYMIGTPQKDMNKVMEEVNKYTKKKINTTIDLKMIDWGDYDKKMQVVIASGEPYDIAFTASWANNYVLNARKGAFKELDQLMDEHGKELKSALDPAFLEGAKIDGKLYAVPTNKEVGQQGVYVFNKRLVDKYKFDIQRIKSFEDLEPMLQTIKEKESGIQPMTTFTPHAPFDYILDDKMPFAVPLEGENKIVNVYETDEMKQNLDTLHKYYKAGYIKSDAATSKEPWALDVENWFVRKELYQPYAENIWSRNAGYELVVQPMHESPITFNNSVTGSMQAISATSKNPERAMEFLNLLNTDEYLRNLMDKGIEGEHYEKLDNGRIKDLPARKNYTVPSFALGNQFILDLYEEDSDDKWEKFEEFNNQSDDAPTLGFYFDPKPVRTEIAAISNVTSEFAQALLTGSVNPDEYLPKFNKKLKEAGLDKALDEMNKQYEEWKKKQ